MKRQQIRFVAYVRGPKISRDRYLCQSVLRLQLQILLITTINYFHKARTHKAHRSSQNSTLISSDFQNE